MGLRCHAWVERQVWRRKERSALELQIVESLHMERVGSWREGKAEGRGSEATEMNGIDQGRRDCEGGRRVMGG